MKIAGHTMGTPEYTLDEAIDLFSSMGLDGVEIIVQDGYLSGLPLDVSRNRLKEVLNHLLDKGLSISCLTPYNSRFNSSDGAVRNSEISGIKKVIDYAEFLDARYIRIYGGNLESVNSENRSSQEILLVKSLQELGDYAAERGVNLVIENHFNTLTESAADSIRISEMIGKSNVGILYDQANLDFTYNEDFHHALDIQYRKIMYAHVKDLSFKQGNNTFTASDVSHPKEEERNVITRIIGEGSMDWRGIITGLKQHGYDGWLSMEYERRWHPDDIPDASIGMKKGFEYLKSII